MLRRSLLARAGPLVAFAAGTCVSTPPVRARVHLRILAAPLRGREAKLGAWNRRFAEGAGAWLDLAPTEAEDASIALAALVAADPSAAEVVWLDHADVPTLAGLGRLRALADLVRRDRYDLKRFMPPALQPAYGLDERLYALPEEVESRQLYFNRQHLAVAGIDVRQAGLDFERPANTWEALRRVNLDLAAAPRTRGRLPFHAGHDGAPLELWGWQNGGSWLEDGGRRAAFDRQENAAALAWLVAHAQELGGPDRLSGVRPFPAPARALTVPAGAAAADLPEHHPFLAGQVSLCFESTRFVSTVASWRPEFPLGYVEPPRRRPGAPLVSWCRSWGYALLSRAPDVAWQALQFLVSEDAAIVDAAAQASAFPLAGPRAGPPAARPRPGHVLWHPPYTGQLAVDKRLALAYRTGSKLLDEARDHGLEQLRHSRFRRPCPAPRQVWPLLEQARRLALAGTLTATGALAAAQREAQAHLDAAWRRTAGAAGRHNPVPRRYGL